MAPILKASLAILSLSGALVSADMAAPRSYGRHNRVVKKALFEGLEKRHKDHAPFGYDRCGFPRQKPHHRKSGASPSASAKPCASFGPGHKGHKKHSTSTGPVATPAPTVFQPALQPASQSTSTTTTWVDTTVFTTEHSSSATPTSSPIHKNAAAAFVADPANGAASSSSSSSSSSSPSKSVAVQVAAPSPSSGSGGGSSNAILGLGWDFRNPSGVLFDWAGAGAVYTWSEFPPTGGMPSGMDWYPMFTCTEKAASFGSQVAAGVIHPGQNILGFNEPDQSGQCPLSVSDGVNSFKNLISGPYGNQGYTLWSPAPTNSDTGRQWLTDFMGQCSDCGISGITLHWYGTSAQEFISYVQGVYDEFHMPIIVSEYAPMDFTFQTPPLSQPEVSAFLATTQAWLKSQSFIKAYMFFGSVTTGALGGVNPAVQLITNGGSLTSLGWQYLENGKN